MRQLTFLSILSIIFAFSAAQAETKVNGEFWGNFAHVLDNGKSGGSDRITPMGTDVTRARVNVSHDFNDMWAATIGLKMVDVSAASGSNVYQAYITGKNWLADGHTFTFGLQKNAYDKAWDASHQEWIHSNLEGEIGSLIDTEYSTMQNEYFAGLGYGIMINDMWNLDIALHSGPNSEIVNGGNSNNSADVTGYALTVNGKLNDNMHLMVQYDTYGAHKNAANDSGADNVNGLTVIRAGFDYTSDMLDAGFEYNMWEQEAATGTDEEGLSAMALHANYKYADNRSAYLWYAMGDGFDDATISVDFDTAYKVGHIWNLDKNVNTGVFYEAATYDTNDVDTSAVVWRWAANF